MVKVKKLVRIILTLAMVTSFSSCSEGSKFVDIKTSHNSSQTTRSEEKVKLKFLSLSMDDNRNNIREKYIKVNALKEMHDVEVEYDLGGGGQDYANKLKAYNAAGDMPDVWFSEQNLSYVVVTAGNALDLLPYVQKSGFHKKFKTKDILTSDKNGKLFCVQPGADQYFTPRLWYHKGMFEKDNIQPPKTFEEFVKVCETLRGKGIVPISIAGKDGWTLNLHMLQTMIMAENPQVAVDLVNNRTDFNNPVIKNALDRIRKLVKVGAFAPDVTDIDYAPAVEMYTSGKAAMLAMFTWEIGNLEKAAPDTDFIPWPSAGDEVDLNGAIQYWGAPLSGYMVSAKTRNPEVAAKFAMFCATQDALYYNTELKAPTMLDTGVKIEGISLLQKKSLDQFNAVRIKVPSIWSAGFDSRMSAEIATQNSKLLTGEYSSEDYIKAISPVWEENFK